METLALLAPITSLEFFEDKFLLTGEGPVLSAYSLHCSPKGFTSLSVLQHQRIHGIRPRSQCVRSAQSSASEHGLTSGSEPLFHDFAVFGGKALRLIRLHVEIQNVENFHFEILGPLLELQDWILDARWLSGRSPSQLCAAVAHNGALLVDVAAGHAVARRFCLEGCLLYSALLVVHESWAETVLVGGTVFNQLIVWKTENKDDGWDSGHKAPVERRLVGHTGVIFSVAYLQEGGFLASASDDRSVRLWGVGALGGPGGKCGDDNPACLRVLYGHQARVFSVRLSPGRVFSAGEDGACLVWDWNEGGKVMRMLKGHRAGGVRALAVSEEMMDNRRWVATGGADGGVRLWNVESGLEESAEAAGTTELTDLKFPQIGLPKIVCMVGGGEDPSWSQFVVCTDGGSVCLYSDGTWGTIWQGTAEFQSYCVMETVTVCVKDSAATVSLCAVGNISGSLEIFPVSCPRSGVRLSGGSGKIQSLHFQKEKDRVYLLASGAEGLVHRWCVEVRQSESCSLVVSLCRLPPFLLPQCAKRWLTAAVRLQPSSKKVLWVCGDRRGSLLLFEENKHLDEGRSREMLDAPLQPLSCLFGVHGKHGVTSVCEYQGLFYSTGKDGCVRVFRVKQSKPDERLENAAEADVGLELDVLRVQRACKGMEWLERTLILESAVCLEEEDHGETSWVFRKQNVGKEARFVIAGFHAAHFVVWDPLRRERLFAVPCGGGHRSWALWPSHTGVWPGYGALVFIKQGAVLTSQPPGEAAGAKAGARDLREGVHGRGIWCVCRVGRIGNEKQKSLWEIIVTGGEDTSLAVLAVHPPSGAVRVLSLITDHISGVRAVTAVRHPHSERGHQPLSVLLVSAGGRAQIQSYRLLVGWNRQTLTPSCQVIQVGGHRLDEQWERRKNRHKTVKMDPETRYVSIAVVEESSDRVLLALSCSDGAVRLFSVTESKNRIDLLWETFHHQRCVLSVATCSLEGVKDDRYKLLFSAATDGKIAVWHLTGVSTDISSGATNPPAPCLDIPAHQSGVNSLVVWVEKLGREGGGGCLVTVASGGDDGQLTVSTIRVQFPGNGKAGGSRGFPETSHCQSSVEALLTDIKELQLHLLSQRRIPLAHAAPLTALKLLSPGLLVSTSSDQRVCLWKVSDAGVGHSGALCSHVADAAAMAVWEGEKEEAISTTGSELVNALCREQESQTQSETKTEETEGGWVSDGEEAAGEQELRQPAVAVKETVDPVCKEEEEDTTDHSKSEPQTDGSGETVNWTNSEQCLKASPDSQTGIISEGWVLVCGQGLQLLRVRSAEMEAWREKKEKSNCSVKVTLQKQPT
ncbi:WD repeat-containing protein 6 [Oryzias melastigma]|uniref:tRNA (34-2'-O)-methyltransferase regulator WDR6 n=1 Tax=Oryzias melastigma TaxID=30732 RepID=A0A3B3BMB8_ORYME|nr:WD repeat-containing protein 6 [Oryzias melastigma]